LYHIGFICDVLVRGKSRISELVDKITESHSEMSELEKNIARYMHIIPSRALKIYLTGNST